MNAKFIFSSNEKTQMRADAKRRQRQEGKDDQILRIVWKVGASPGGPCVYKILDDHCAIEEFELASNGRLSA
jgi:hypothetical protein